MTRKSLLRGCACENRPYSTKKKPVGKTYNPFAGVDPPSAGDRVIEETAEKIKQEIRDAIKQGQTKEGHEEMVTLE